ncbi:MAG: hypothetical protein HRF49_07715 [bacterium]
MVGAEKQFTGEQMPKTAVAEQPDLNPLRKWAAAQGYEKPEDVYRMWLSAGHTPIPSLASFRNWWDGMIPSTAYFMILAIIMGVDPAQLSVEWLNWEARNAR